MEAVLPRVPPSSPDPGRYQTPHLRRVPGGAFCVPPAGLTVGATTRCADAPRVDRCLTTDGLGNTEVQQHCRTVVRRRSARHGARAEGTRLPTPGAPAVTSAGGGLHTGAMAQLVERPAVHGEVAGSRPA